MVNVTYSDLYQLDKQHRIIFNFETIPANEGNPNCQVIFQNRFFSRYYMYFVRDFSLNQPSFRISFVEIKSSDFRGVGIFITIILILTVLTVIIMGCIICYRRYMKYKARNYNESKSNNGVYKSVSD